MRFEITYVDSYDDCDSITVGEDEVFYIPHLDGASGTCGGGVILDDDDDEIEDDITLYRGVDYVLRGDTLYAIVGRRRKEIPWDDYLPEW